MAMVAGSPLPFAHNIDTRCLMRARRRWGGRSEREARRARLLWLHLSRMCISQEVEVANFWAQTRHAYALAAQGAVSGRVCRATPPAVTSDMTAATPQANSRALLAGK